MGRERQGFQRGKLLKRKSDYKIMKTVTERPKETYDVGGRLAVRNSTRRRNSLVGSGNNAQQGSTSVQPKIGYSPYGAPNCWFQLGNLLRQLVPKFVPGWWFATQTVT